MAPPIDSKGVLPTSEWRLHQIRTDRGYRIGVFVSDEQAVLLRLAARGGSLALVELHLVPLAQLEWLTDLRRNRGEDGTPITARALRQLPVGELTERLAREVVSARSSVAAYPDALIATFAGNYGLPVRSISDVRGLMGALKGEDMVLATVALYLDAAASGDPAPAASTAEALGVSTKAVHSRLARARAEGWLSTAGAGRPGGELSEASAKRLRTALGGSRG